MTAVSRRGFLAGMGGLGLLAAGCGSTEAAAPTRSGPAALRLWTHDPSYVATFRAAIADPAIMAGSPFSPALEVTAATGDDLVTRTMTQAIANGTPPDLLGLIISVFPRVMKSRIAENLFLDLTDTVAPFGADLLRTAPYTVDGRLYALDSDTCISVLYYREDEYARAGIPADLGSWDELIELRGADGPAPRRTGGPLERAVAPTDEHFATAAAYRVELDPGDLSGVHQLLLRLDWVGDVGRAEIDGRVVAETAKPVPPRLDAMCPPPANRGSVRIRQRPACSGALACRPYTLYQLGMDTEISCPDLSAAAAAPP